MIDGVAGGLSIELKAVRGLSQDVASITEIIALANEAFDTGVRRFCGTM